MGARARQATRRRRAEAKIGPAAARRGARSAGSGFPTSEVYLRKRLGSLVCARNDAAGSLEAVGRSLRICWEPGLPVSCFPLRLAAHAPGRVRQGLEPLVSDLAATVLADAISALSLAVAGVVGLLPVPLEDLLDGLVVGPLGLHLGEIGFPETLAHINSVSTRESFET